MNVFFKTIVNILVLFYSFFYISSKEVFARSADNRLSDTQQKTKTMKSYENTVYLPSYRLPRRQHRKKSKYDAFTWNQNSPDLFLRESNPFSQNEKYRLFQEYLISMLASRRVTQINYFGIRPNAGRAKLDFSDIDMSHIIYLKKLREVYPFQLLICLSGNSSQFKPAVRTQKTRNALAVAIVKFIEKWDLDGIDLDWEYPRNKKDMSQYIQLIHKIRSLLHQEKQYPSKKISIAVSRRQSALNKTLFASVDQINFMSYDFAPRHSTLEDAVEMLEYFMTRFSIPSHKIFLGVPFYGRPIQGNSRRAKSYSALSTQYTITPKDNEIENYYFNGPSMILKKFQLVQEKNLGGLMVWEIGQDHHGAKSLLRVLPPQHK